VTNVGYGVFEECTGLTEAVIQEGVISIGIFAFRGCTSLTEAAIPGSVTRIGHGAFRGCTRLTSVTIPDSVTGVGLGAFYKCTALEVSSMSITTTQLAAKMNIPRLVLEEVSGKASQVITVLKESYTYQYLSNAFDSARLVVHRLQVQDFISLAPHYAYPGHKEGVYTFLLCMARIEVNYATAADCTGLIQPIPVGDIGGKILDHRTLTELAFIVDSDSNDLAAVDSIPSRSAFLMDGR
jgi:hypothetical protein